MPLAILKKIGQISIAYPGEAGKYAMKIILSYCKQLIANAGF